MPNGTRPRRTFSSTALRSVTKDSRRYSRSLVFYMCKVACRSRLWSPQTALETLARDPKAHDAFHWARNRKDDEI